MPKDHFIFSFHVAYNSKILNCCNTILQVKTFTFSWIPCFQSYKKQCKCIQYFSYFIILRLYPIWCTYLKLNRSIFDLLLINCNFNVQCSIICQNDYGTLETNNGLYNILYGIDFCLINVKLEKNYLFRRIMCRCTIKQITSSYFLKMNLIW